MAAARRYWLGLGANLGDRRAAIEAALAWLDRVVAVEAVSAAFETAPREVIDQPPFLNAAARVATPLPPPRAALPIRQSGDAISVAIPGGSASVRGRSTATCCCGRAASGATGTSRCPTPA